MNSTGNPSRMMQMAVLGFGVLAISSSSILIRLAQNANVPSLVIAAWRNLIAAAVLLPFAFLRRRQELKRLNWRDWGLALLSGVMLGVHFASWISSLAFTSITSSTVLVTTSPLWVGLAAPIFLGEALPRVVKRGILLAVLGSVVVGLGEVVGFANGRFLLNLSPASTHSNPLLGNGLALLGGLTAAVYLLIGRQLRPKLSLLGYTAVVYSTSALTLLLLVWTNGYSLWGYAPDVYLLFLAMAVFPQLIGHTSFNWALSFLPVAFVSVATISEPVGAGLLAILFFGEFPGILTLLGGLLILVGVLLVGRARN